MMLPLAVRLCSASVMVMPSMSRRVKPPGKTVLMVSDLKSGKESIAFATVVLVLPHAGGSIRHDRVVGIDQREGVIPLAAGKDVVADVASKDIVIVGTGQVLDAGQDVTGSMAAAVRCRWSG